MSLDDPGGILLDDYRAVRKMAAHGMKDRIAPLLVMSGSAAMLGVARWLTPSPTGVGTHEQLGLPACMFLKLTGIPCPSCGLTTSVAHAVRFEFAAAFAAQPFGVLVAGIAAAMIPVSLFMVVRSTGFATVVPYERSAAMTYGLVSAYLLAWIYKICAMQWSI